jgi:hypothetical protein
MMFGSPEEILETFDLNICRMAYLPESKTFIDKRGDNPNEIHLTNVKNYKILDRVIKYSYRGFQMSVSLLHELKEYMTSDGLSEIDFYGEEVCSKMSSFEFDSKIMQCSGIPPRVFLGYFEEYDFLQEALNLNRISSTIWGMAYPFNDYKNIIHSFNDNQRYAFMVNHGKLIGQDLREAINKYPDIFV